MQGYTYQNLLDCGFSYVTTDINIMSDAYLKEKGIDKQKALERQKENHRKTIGETQMIPYVIMGMKAMVQNQKQDRVSLLDRIEKIEGSLTHMNDAMYQALQKVDIIADQTSCKLESIHEQNIVQSISDDSFKDLQERLQKIENAVNKLIKNNDVQIKKNIQQDNDIILLEHTVDTLKAQIAAQQPIIDQLIIKFRLAA